MSRGPYVPSVEDEASRDRRAAMNQVEQAHREEQNEWAVEQADDLGQVARDEIGAPHQDRCEPEGAGRRVG